MTESGAKLRVVFGLDGIFSAGQNENQSCGVRILLKSIFFAAEILNTTL